jgi:hypothetical protein
VQDNTTHIVDMIITQNQEFLIGWDGERVIKGFQTLLPLPESKSKGIFPHPEH